MVILKRRVYTLLFFDFINNPLSVAVPHILAAKFMHGYKYRRKELLKTYSNLPRDLTFYKKNYCDSALPKGKNLSELCVKSTQKARKKLDVARTYGGGSVLHNTDKKAVRTQTRALETAVIALAARPLYFACQINIILPFVRIAKKRTRKQSFHYAFCSLYRAF